MAITTLDRFRALPHDRRLGVAGVLLALVALLAAAAWFVLWRNPYRPLFTDLKTADAATIIAELDRTKTPYQLDDDGSTILVPEDRVAPTRIAVMGADLPLKGTVGFEIFNESDMGLTEFAQRINYQRALQGELARTIMTLQSIDTARLHLTLGERALFREQRTPSKASVTVIPRVGMQVDGPTVAGIQRLVAGAVPDLEAGNVAVIDGMGRVISGGAPTVSVLTGTQPMSAWEHGYADRIRAAIEAAFPARPVTVRVLAPLAPDEGVANDALRTVAVRVDLQFSGGDAAPPAVQQVVADAIGFVDGDVVVTSVVPSALPQPSGPAPRPVAPPTPAGAGASDSIPDGALWWGGSALVLGILLLIAARRRRAVRAPLDDEQRLAFADRLRDALDRQDTANARR
ncbi:flagellar basal-body MS-ring/collar protein FliF [Sphingomonas sanxanigenens]|uniref:Flagellar M-ring N-terminal domain-containing protein n=1 Tax=Sphingomonas sanxanigenens DSM 19645 = NX02 TaxID=1123269 RepID=W0AEX6_9SPHN|nr:flagellar basal-body MS-ring/collar protein FliF [Sphingomonas sanxanigenens]AHE55651.1 hypothetical protein NX02_19960 [Sphingomonas sanxanigenens DSM 19645 = NX02]